MEDDGIMISTRRWLGEYLKGDELDALDFLQGPVSIIADVATAELQFFFLHPSVVVCCQHLTF